MPLKKSSAKDVHLLPKRGQKRGCAKVFQHWHLSSLGATPRSKNSAKEGKLHPHHSGGKDCLILSVLILHPKVYLQDLLRRTYSDDNFLHLYILQHLIHGWSKSDELSNYLLLVKNTLTSQRILFRARDEKLVSCLRLFHPCSCHRRRCFYHQLVRAVNYEQ